MQEIYRILVLIAIDFIILLLYLLLRVIAIAVIFLCFL